MKTIRTSTLVLTGVMLATGLFAQTPAHSHDHSAQTPARTGKQAPPKPGMMDDKTMMAHCMEMMQKHDQMQADFKAMDAKMDDLVAKMTAASGADRYEAMTAVVTEMIAQQRTQRDKAAAMQSEMMQHMMEHMQMGKQSKSMPMCPMMKGMQMPPSGSATPEDHSKHHQP